MSTLTFEFIQKSPIQLKAPQFSTIKVPQPIPKPGNVPKSNNFKNIFTAEMQHQNDIAAEMNVSRVAKIEQIKNKVANSYYFQQNISEIIAEKLMNGWT